MYITICMSVLRNETLMMEEVEYVGDVEIISGEQFHILEWVILQTTGIKRGTMGYLFRKVDYFLL